MRAGARRPRAQRAFEFMRLRRRDARRVRWHGRGRACSLASALLLAAIAALTSTAVSAAAEARHVTIAFSCTGVTFSYSGFPGGVHTMRELVLLNGVIVRDEPFALDGSSGTNTVEYDVPAGAYEEKAEVLWNIDGAGGESHRAKESMTSCATSEAKYSINELQTIAGTGAPFTASPLKARAGQTVEYQTTVSNTGDVPLLLYDFDDPNCDSATIAGGPGGTPLAPGAQTVYTCDLPLTEAGSFENKALITATPSGGGEEISEGSNIVLTAVEPRPRLEIADSQEIRGGGAGFTAATLSASVGQTIDYQVIVRNGGNEPLYLREPADPYCGTLTGGPPSGQPLRPGDNTTYRCSRWLNEGGTVENRATIVGTPPGGEAIVEASNLVTVKVKGVGAAPSGVIASGGDGGGGAASKGEVSAASYSSNEHARITAALAKALDPSGRSARLRALLKADGMWASFSAPTAGHLVISWFQISKRAHLAGKVQPVLVARGTIDFVAAGTKRVFLRLTSAGRRLLRSARRISLTARGSFTPTGAATLVVTKSIVLKR